jgi:hypothetical protein
MKTRTLVAGLLASALAAVPASAQPVKGENVKI